MRRSVLPLLTFLCVATASTAAALEVNGRVGALYVRSDAYDPASVESTEARLDLDLALDARGFFSSRDVFNWSLGAAYRRLSRDLDGDSASLQDSIFYNGRAALFSARTSPLTLTLDANRVQTEFSSGEDLRVTGETVTQTAGGTVAIRVADRPALTLGYHRIDLDASTPGIGLTERTTDRITGSLRTGTGAFDVQADYTGDLNDGTYSTDRTDLHSLGVNVRVPLSSTVEVVASDIYQALVPDRLEPGSIDQETNAFRIFAKNRGQFGNRQLISYSYVHTLTETLSTPLREVGRQSLRYEGDLLLTDPDLFTRWMVDGSVQQARSGGTELESTGETAGVQLWWRRPTATSTVELHGGPLVGFIQSDTAGDLNGWGLSGAGRATFPWSARSVGVNYSVDYASDLFGSPGWSLRQAAGVSLSGPIGRGRYSAAFSGSGFRTETPLFGGGLGRSLDLYLTAASQRTHVEVRASLQDGMSGASQGDIVGDGLVIPAPFDTKSRQILLRATQNLLAGLSATAHLRYLNTTYPGQPSLNQLEGLASIQYAYGALTFALEDRLQRYEEADGWSTANQVMVRVYRAFGWRNF